MTTKEILKTNESTTVVNSVYQIVINPGVLTYPVRVFSGLREQRVVGELSRIATITHVLSPIALSHIPPKFRALHTSLIGAQISVHSHTSRVEYDSQNASVNKGASKYVSFEHMLLLTVKVHNSALASITFQVASQNARCLGQAIKFRRKKKDNIRQTQRHTREATGFNKLTTGIQRRNEYDIKGSKDASEENWGFRLSYYKRREGR